MKPYTIPDIITETNLPELTDHFKDAIAKGQIIKNPNVCVRYSTGSPEFYTANLGDFFFYEGTMYVFDKKKIWAYMHEPKVVRAYFGRDLPGRGYAHKVALCGIRTPFKDRDGRYIFTGDICYTGPRLNWKDFNNFHVATSSEYDGYGFAMDNCMMLLKDMWHAPKRVGTIFYKLSFDEIKNTRYACTDISSMYGPNENIEKHLMMGKLTPCFSQDELEYEIISYLTGELDWKYAFDKEKSYPEVPKPSTRVSPDRISFLDEQEIFVFGSNKQGHHMGGAARYASDKFGAEWGVGEGLTGQCYALPTMEGEESFKQAVKTFFACADQHPELKFLVTAVGCGIAGYKVDDVAVWFARAIKSHNVYLPQSFWTVIKARYPKANI